MTERAIPITDAQDPRVAPYIGLRDAHLAREHPADPDRPGGIFIAEGHAVVRILLSSRFETLSVLATENRLGLIAADVPPDVPIYKMSRQAMSQVVGFDIHRGVLAAGRRVPEPTLEDLAANASSVIALEGLSNHDNVGALFRNAAALGGSAPRVLLDPESCDPLYRKSIRVSMGHALRVPFRRSADFVGDLSGFRDMGFETIALEITPDAQEIATVSIADRPRVLVLGAEGPGISNAVLESADRVVKVPIDSGVASLNVATAAAIAMHRLLEQR